MKTNALIFTFLFLPVALLVFALPTGCETAEFKGNTANEEEIAFPDMPRITAEELKQKLDSGADLVIVDTRDSGSYEAGHIKGAMNIYYDPTGDPMDREMKLIELPMDKLIVTYCD